VFAIAGDRGSRTDLMTRFVPACGTAFDRAAVVQPRAEPCDDAGRAVDRSRVRDEKITETFTRGEG
jgi:hypothetical protein